MSCKDLVISVVLLGTLVLGIILCGMLLRDKTLSRQEDDQKLSNRLDAIERILFMHCEMNDSFMLTETLPKLIDTVRHLSTNLNSPNRALKQIEEKLTAISATLKILANRMETIEDELIANRSETIEDTLSKDSDAILKEEEKHPSCLSLHESGQTVNGLYDIYPVKGGVAVKVYCDMTTDGGGWTVFQRRQDGSVDFYRGWADYKRGFGEVDGEFWLGNDVIAELTSDCCHELRVDMGDFDGAHRYAHCDSFKVSPESDKYKLTVGGYSGDAGDSLSYHNNTPFTTKDRDNDDATTGNCAAWASGAWWYKWCHNSNLNGKYLRGAHTANARGVNWKHWLGFEYSLKMTEMKLR